MIIFEEVLEIDPNAATLTDDEVVEAVNRASTKVEPGALAPTAARDNLNAMPDKDREYVRTNPSKKELKVTALQRKKGKKDKLTVDFIP